MKERKKKDGIYMYLFETIFEIKLLKNYSERKLFPEIYFAINFSGCGSVFRTPTTAYRNGSFPIVCSTSESVSAKAVDD